jgi:Fur family ferric uptake transcriptional regulator
LEELRKLTSHPTAADLHRIARTRLPRISLGTVYRNLEQLVEAGVVRKLDIGGAEARFDADTHQHYHVRCVRCERVDDVHDLPSGLSPEEVEVLDGYEIVGFHLEFSGICPVCRSNPAPGAGGASAEEQD